MSTQTESAPFRPYLMPNVLVEEVETLRDFYIGKLGFEHMMGIIGKDGRLDFCIVTRDGNSVMIGRPEDPEGRDAAKPGPRSVEFFFYVENVDAYHEQIAARGVRLTEKLVTQWWGDRTFALRDPYGYQIWFCQTVGEFEPPPGTKVL